MFDLDSWFMPENRGDRQKEIEEIYLPYKCGKIEAELIALRFINHEPLSTYLSLQPHPMTLL
jgi:hypothetical protein